jgi:hypothetical protein
MHVGYVHDFYVRVRSIWYSTDIPHEPWSNKLYNWFFFPARPTQQQLFSGPIFAPMMIFVQLEIIMVPVSFIFQCAFFRLLFLFLVSNSILFLYGICRVPYYLSRLFINRLLTLFFVFYIFRLFYYFLFFLIFLVSYLLCRIPFYRSFLLILNNIILPVLYNLSSRNLLKLLVSLIVQICIFFIIFPRNWYLFWFSRFHVLRVVNEYLIIFRAQRLSYRLCFFHITSFSYRAFTLEFLS